MKNSRQNKIIRFVISTLFYTIAIGLMQQPLWKSILIALIIVIGVLTQIGGTGFADIN